MVKLVTQMLRRLNATCEDTTPWVSEMMDHSLPLSRRWRVALHLFLCKACQVYKQQLAIIRKAARRLGGEDPPLDPTVGLREEARNKIKKALRDTA